MYKITDSIDLVTRNTLKSKWTYPDNVTINYVNKIQYEGFAIEKIPIWLKLQHFFNFIVLLKKLIKRKQTKILIVHDVIPLFAAYLLKKPLKKNQIKLIDFKTLDLAGRWHHLTITPRIFTSETIDHGNGFDSSSYCFITLEK